MTVMLPVGTLLLLVLNGVGMIDLGTLDGKSSNASAINDSGEVVGNSETANGDSHAFLYSHDGMTDLSLLAPVIASGYTETFFAVLYP